MSRRLPSLNALRMFEAVARLNSFKLAAEELHVTQSAVSRQVQTLEAQLGVALFERRNRAITLTEAGEQLLPVMTRALDDLALTTGRLKELGTALDAPLRLVISATPGIAELWLGARLGRFCRQHPNIDPEILVSADLRPLLQGRAQVAILWGQGDWPDLEQIRLHPTLEFPVCSPHLLRHGPPLHSPADLRHHRLLHWQSRGWWGAWLRHFSVLDVNWNIGPLLHDYAMTLDMAMAGEGVALADDLLAADHVLAGRLTKPLDEVRSPDYQQLLLQRPGDTDPAVAAFRSWLQEEIREHARIAAPLREPHRFESLAN